MHRGERTDISKAHEFFERQNGKPVKWQERATSEKQEEQEEER